ncbi:MAG: S-methyl-5'-thioadenosine phosphorylase [Deltaproteobacteria bacterium]|nr:S-methyl-5'-thioadenosine phosphorylase [Deltaproteobacteria bacterium]
MSDSPTIAVIGGSGLYNLEGLEDVQQEAVDTPFGEPSSPIVRGRLGDTALLFLARHGIGHRLIPSEVNYRANIWALKSLGAEQVISVSAVGSMREDIHPGDFVLVDQFIDRTKGRSSTFFGDGMVGHVGFADPVCPSLAARLLAATEGLGLKTHRGGTLMVMEGPAFSTRAESRMHRQLGVDLIGMTAMPEAKLARESELCYATLAMATDYDCWNEAAEDVSVMSVIEILKQNVENARAVLAKLATDHQGGDRDCSCATALEHAIITDRAVIPAEAIERLKPIIGRVLK